MARDGGIGSMGWIGGQGVSAADDLWESMWGGRAAGVPMDRVTEGPLAEFPMGYDAIEHQRMLRHDHQEKTARVIGSDNNFDSSGGPGENRVVQQGGSSSDPVTAQTPDHARGVGGEAGTKKDSSPAKGSLGGDLMRKIKAKGQGDPVKAETGTRSVGGDARAPAHNLQVKEPAPVPKEMDPARRPAPPKNLADYENRSAWTGSGPQAALHNDYSKVGELATGLLELAGVPPRPLPEHALLSRVASSVAVSELSKTASLGFLGRGDIHPLKVVAELSDGLGEDWVEWDPETIRDTLIKDAGIEPSDDVMSKIMAVKIVLAAPERFYDDWQAMEKISVALNDASPVPGVVEDVPVEWLSNAVTIVEKIAGAGDFSPDVTKYVAARLFDQGYVVAPPKLAFADPVLGEHVGNDALRKKVILAYAKALDSDSIPGSENPVSIQVSRLFRNHLYVLSKLDESREQMA